MARKLWHGIASLFGLGRQDDAADDVATAAARQRPVDRTFSSAQATAIASYRAAIDAGKLHLLDLAKVRGELGESWPQVRERVSTAIESILRQRLGPADVHYRLEETAYVLILETATPAEARMLCGLIASEIRHKLFGEERELSAIEVSSAVAGADGGVEFVSVDPAAAVIEALKSSGAAEAEADASAQPGKPEDSWQPIEHRPAERPPPEFVPITAPTNSIDAIVRSVERQIETGFDPVSAPTRRIYDPAKAADEQNALARRMAALQVLVQSRLASPAAAAVMPATARRSEPDALVDAISFAYQPAWDCDRHAVTSYNLRVKVEVGGKVKRLSEVEGHLLRPETIAAIDLLAVKKAVADLQTMLSRGVKAILSVPLHRAVLEQSARREPILGVLAQQSRHVRRLLQIEIVDAYAGDWALLPALLAMCRRACRDVVIRLSLDEVDMARMKSVGFRTVGGDLRDHPWPEALAMKKMEAFAAAADEARLMSYLTGLDTTSSVVAAVCSGFQLVAGDAVAPEVEFPTGVYLFDTVNLFLRKRGARNRA